LAQQAALLDVDDLHIAVPMKRDRRKILRNGAGIDVERKEYIAMFFRFFKLHLAVVFHAFHPK
jgi:hypothetical protein